MEFEAFSSMNQKESSGQETDKGSGRRSRRLEATLRVLGTLDFCAVTAVIAPRAWIARLHEWLGLGSLPDGPLVEYLARCTSTWYASFGLLLWFVSGDVERYARLIRFLAGMLIVQGMVIVVIDLVSGMPGWWTALEGPCCSGSGAVLLLMQQREAQSIHEP